MSIIIHEITSYFAIYSSIITHGRHIQRNEREGMEIRIF